MSPSPIVRSFSQYQDYTATWQRMQDFTQQRQTDTADEIWFLEHNPVYTLGQAGKEEHILSPADIPIVKSDRGGQVTYHGPGQAVVYLLLDLKRYQLGVRELVTRIENTIINTLAKLDINAYARKDAPGVYVNNTVNAQNIEQKIAALGLRVRRHYCYHGLSFNRDMDLKPFYQINPCGYPGMEVTQLTEQYTGDCSRNHVEALLLDSLLLELQIQSVDKQIE